MSISAKAQSSVHFPNLEMSPIITHFEHFGPCRTPSRAWLLQISPSRPKTNCQPQFRIEPVITRSEWQVGRLQWRQRARVSANPPLVIKSALWHANNIVSATSLSDIRGWTRGPINIRRELTQARTRSPRFRTQARYWWSQSEAINHIRSFPGYGPFRNSSKKDQRRASNLINFSEC